MGDPFAGFRLEPYLTIVLKGDRCIEVVPLTFGRARITVTDGLSVFDGW